MTALIQVHGIDEQARMKSKLGEHLLAYFTIVVVTQQNSGTEPLQEACFVHPAHFAFTLATQLQKTFPVFVFIIVADPEIIFSIS